MFFQYKLVKPLLGKDISDKSSVDTNLSNNEDKSAMEVKEHFMQLLQIHGHKKTDQTAKNLSSLSEDTIEKEQPQSYQSAASQSIQDSDYEPVRKKVKSGIKFRLFCPIVTYSTSLICEI